MVQLQNVGSPLAGVTVDDDLTTPLPDHTQLPESDGTFVKNFQEHPQSLLLTDAIVPVLDRRHPNGNYAIGQDSGIYWRQTEPPEKGTEAPDWFYVPGVPPLLDGQFRRSYVLWKEYIPPLIVLEFASGDGGEERDDTPLAALNGTRSKPGKFWVYEQILRVPYYGIYEFGRGRLEVYRLLDGRYCLVPASQDGRFPVAALGVELGLWEGICPGTAQVAVWLRWWDEAGDLLLTGQERAEVERSQKEVAIQQVEALQSQLDVGVVNLLQMGLSVEQVAMALGLSVEQVSVVASGIAPDQV